MNIFHTIPQFKRHFRYRARRLSGTQGALHALKSFLDTFPFKKKHHFSINASTRPSTLGGHTATTSVVSE